MMNWFKRKVEYPPILKRVPVNIDAPKDEAFINPIFIETVDRMDENQWKITMASGRRLVVDDKFMNGLTED